MIPAEPPSPGTASPAGAAHCVAPWYHPSELGGTRAPAVPAGAVPHPGNCHILAANHLSGARATVVGHAGFKRIAKGAPQNQPGAPAAEPDAFGGQGEVQGKTTLVLQPPSHRHNACAQRWPSRLEWGQVAHAARRFGAFQRQRVGGEGKTSPFTCLHWWGAPCEVPAAWERQDTAGSPGTAGRILPHRHQGGTSSEGALNPAVHPHSLRAAALPTLCLGLNHGLHFEAVFAQ